MTAAGTDTLLVRIVAIEDRFAILDLEADYAASWDFVDADKWASLFTVDGLFELEAAGSIPATSLRGHSELAAFCSEVSERWAGLHYMHPPRLDLEGDTARSLLYFEFRHVMTNENVHVRQGMTGGYYRTEYRRTAAGWKITSRTETPVFENVINSYNYLTG